MRAVAGTARAAVGAEERDGGMAEGAREAPPALEISSSEGLTDWLSDTGVSLAFTTGASGKLIFVGVNDGRLSVFERSFDRTTGLYAEGDALVMAGPYQIWRFDNALAPGQSADGYDRLYVPQVAYITGDVGAYDVAIAGNGEIVFSSTLFSCLATVDTEFSFAPVWHPPFIGQLAPEERCLVTGFATEKGAPRYVTAAARTDIRRGWRVEAGVSGCIVDAHSGDIVADGLALPIAPRLHAKRLWVAEGGSGYVGTVDLETGSFDPVAFCPGYLRGLVLHGKWAVAATSKTLLEGDVPGLPLGDNLTEHKAEARCAVVVIDTEAGELVHWLRLEGVIDQIADVAVLPGARRPAAVGLRGDDIRRVVSIAPPMGEAGATRRGRAAK
jgi:uncharacterized protein (TIGR03032 family)